MGASVGVMQASGARRFLARWVPRVSRTPLSVRIHMVGLILVIVAPLLMFSAFLVLRSAEHEQEIMASTVRERTQIAAAALDRELSGLRARLFILAASNHLRAGDLDEFARQSEETSRQLGLPVILSDVNGQELVDTRVPFDQPLPMMSDREAIRRVVMTGDPDVSGIIGDGAPGGFMVALSVPVLRNSRLVYVLSFDIAPIIPQIVAGLGLPPEWLAAVSDQKGVTVARSREADRFVGQMGRPAIIKRLHEVDAGWFPLVSRDGVPVYNAFARVKLADWVISVGIPDDVLFAPVRRSTWILSLAGAVALAFALLLAQAIARRIARPITALVAYADVVGRGGRIALHTTGIQEADAVANSLHQASVRLQQNAADAGSRRGRTAAERAELSLPRGGPGGCQRRTHRAAASDSGRHRRPSANGSPASCMTASGST